MGFIRRIFGSCIGTRAVDDDNAGSSSGLLSSNNGTKEISKASTSSASGEQFSLSLNYRKLDSKIRAVFACAYSGFDPFSEKMKNAMASDVGRLIKEEEKVMMKKWVKAHRKAFQAIFFQLIAERIPSLDLSETGIQSVHQLSSFKERFAEGDVLWGPIGKKLRSLELHQWIDLKDACELMCQKEDDAASGNDADFFKLLPLDMDTFRDKLSKKVIKKLYQAVDAGLTVQQKIEKVAEAI